MCVCACVCVFVCVCVCVCVRVYMCLCVYLDINSRLQWDVMYCKHRGFCAVHIFAHFKQCIWCGRFDVSTNCNHKRTNRVNSYVCEKLTTQKSMLGSDMGKYRRAIISTLKALLHYMRCFTCILDVFSHFHFSSRFHLCFYLRGHRHVGIRNASENERKREKISKHKKNVRIFVYITLCVG